MNERSFESLDEANQALEAAQSDGIFSADAPADFGPGRPLTSLEEAQELAYDAHDTAGRRRVMLARKALALSQDCADAWSLLGDAAATPEEALEQYSRAVEAGARALGDDGLARAAGRFWGDLRTRPYMRARAALAGELVTLERIDEAVEHYRALLELNPNDNQGIRQILLPLFLRWHRDADARDLMARYPDDPSSEFAYGLALLRFRESGDSSTARAALRVALATNRYVAAFLLDPDAAPWLQDIFVTLGGADEAVGVAGAYLAAFDDTPGALDWLEKESAERVAPRRGPAREQRSARPGRFRH
jgi:tetratricopeptide (TPR) repeat protein